jgi:N-methylhydantoinase A
MSAEELAHGIIEIANWNQPTPSARDDQRGIDPRGFGCSLLWRRRTGAVARSDGPARHEGLHRRPIPATSAFGLLAVDWRTDHIVTKVMHEDAINLAMIASLYSDLERDAIATLTRDGIDPARIRILREADVRYAGQSMEVRVAAPAGVLNQAFLAGLIDAFHAAHLKTFGYNYAGAQKVELVNFCVSGFGLIERPQLPKLAARGGTTPARKSVRPVYFDGAFRDTPIYDRVVLPPGYA